MCDLSIRGFGLHFPYGHGSGAFPCQPKGALTASGLFSDANFARYRQEPGRSNWQLDAARVVVEKNKKQQAGDAKASPCAR